MLGKDAVAASWAAYRGTSWPRVGRNTRGQVPLGVLFRLWTMSRQDGRARYSSAPISRNSYDGGRADSHLSTVTTDGNPRVLCSPAILGREKHGTGRRRILGTDCIHYTYIHRRHRLSHLFPRRAANGRRQATVQRAHITAFGKQDGRAQVRHGRGMGRRHTRLDRSL